MTGAAPQAAVIVPHYNDSARLTRCLEALLPQMQEGVELVVVDNASTEDLSGLRARWPDLRLVTEPRKGAANARNRGVAETTAPLLFFLDCDCVPNADWLQTALAVSGQADLIGGRLTVFDETPPPRSGAEAFETVFAFENRAYVEQKGFSVTANLLTRRDVFEAVGPLTHGLSEDWEWCRRATAKGYRLAYEDTLVVAHPARADWPALRRKWRRLTEEMFQLGGTGPRARARWGLRALLMPVSVLAHLPRVLLSPRLGGWGERLRGAGTLLRQRLARMIWMLGQALRGA